MVTAPSPLTVLRRLALLTGAGALLTLSCGREVTGPDTGEGVRRSRAIAFETAFPAGYTAYQTAGGTVDFSTVRIVLNYPDGTVALDTVIRFPADSTSIQLTLSIPLRPSAPPSGQPLNLSLDYRNDAGQSVFKGGPVEIVAQVSTGSGPTPPPAPVTVPVTYTGPGATARTLRISPTDLTVNTGATFAFTAQALDANGAVLAGTPIVFSVEDNQVATINSATGAGRAGNKRGSTTVTARTLTGLSAEAPLTVRAVAQSLALVSGDDQSANVRAALANPVVVKVTASDGDPLAGVPVTFAAGQGGNASPASATTDANGRAQATWTLGPTAGAQTLTVASAGLHGSPVIVNATAKALAPVQVVVATQPPGSVAAGAAFGLVAHVLDVNGAVVPSFTDKVTVALASDAPARAALGGTASVSAVAGVATFTDLKLTFPGTYTLQLSAPGLRGATTAPFQITAGSAASLVFQGYPLIGAVAGAVLDDITVQARDAAGNDATAFSGPVTLTINRSAVDAPAPVEAFTVNAKAGLATFSGLKLTKAGAYALTASSEGLSSVKGPSFNITPGPASNLTLVSGGGQNGAAGSTLAKPIVVLVTDRFGNAVPGVTVNFAPATGSGSVSPSSAVSDGDGVAQTSWTLGVSGGSQTLNVSGSGLAPSPLAVTATAPAPAYRLVITTDPGAFTRIAGSTLPPFVVQAFDASNNPMAGSYSVLVNVTGSPAGVLLTGTTATGGTGPITFDSFVLTKSGTYTLTFSSPSAASVVSAPFTITAHQGIPAVDSGSGQSGVPGSTLPTPFVARFLDMYGNPAVGITVNWVVTAGGGSISPTTSVTDANGRARATLTLGAVAGTNTVTASEIGSGDPPATFNATGVAGAAASLEFTAGPTTVQAGVPMGAIVVTAKDASGNVATGFTDFVSVDISANAYGAIIWNGTVGVYAVAGVATFTAPNISIRKAGTGYTLKAVATGLPVATSSPFDILAAPAFRVTADSGYSQTGAAGSTLPTVLVGTVVDSVSNPVTGATVSWAVTSGGGSLSGATTTSDAKGRVRATWTLGPTTGAQSVELSGTGLSTSPATFDATATAGSPALLAWTGAPAASTAAGTALGPLTVAVQDAGHNTVTSFTGNVTVAITANPSGGTLSGTATVAAVAGVATFSDLSIDKAGVGYSLTASSGALTTATTSPFDITAGAASALLMVSGNSQSGVVSTALGLPLVVSVKDALGNPVSGHAITWTVTAGGGSITGGSVTDASGTASASWTLGAATGTQTVSASASGLSGSPVNFSATAIPLGATRVWVGGNVSGPSTWAIAANWSPAVVPSSSDIVYVAPVTPTSNQPMLTAGGVTVAGLTVDPASSLNVQSFGITVTGNLDARGGITGTGTVTMSGPSATLMGTIPALFVTGGVSLVGSTTVTTSVMITGALYIGAASLNVGTLSVVGGSAHMQMANAAGHVTVAGMALFNGADHNGWLTAGELEMQGGFTQQATFSSQSFFATSGHTVRFSGTSAQVVAFASPGPGAGNTSFFQNVAVNPSAMLTASSTIYVGGSLTSGASSNLSGVTSLVMYGAAPVPFPAIGGLPPASLTIAGHAALASAMTYPGPLTISGQVTLNANTLTVDTDLSVAGGSAHLTFNNASSYVLVKGNATFNGADHNGHIGTGTLEVRGNFTQLATYSTQSFFATASHLTKLTGTNQTVSFASPGPGSGNSSFFANLSVPGATTVASSGTLYVGGTFGAAASSDLSGVAGVNMYGAVPFPVVAGVPPASFTASGSLSLPASLTYPASLTISGQVTLNAYTLTVENNLTVLGGSAHLTFNDAASYVLVKGNATFNGADHNGHLGTGTLEVRGDFTQLGTYSAQSYFATSAHTTLFTGTTQAVSFANPGPGSGNSSFFAHVSVPGATTLTSANGFYVGGTFGTGVSSDLSGVSSVTMYGTVPFPTVAGVPPASFTAAGALALTGNVTYPASLTITGQVTLNAYTLTVANHLAVVGGSAHLTFNNASSYALVKGNATFNGADHNGHLGTGTLEVRGDFTQQATYSAQSFFATAAHLTKFTGVSQAVSFASPGPGSGNSSFFANLSVPGATTVSSSGTLYVGGTFATAAGSNLGGVANVNMFGTVAFPTVAGTPPAAFTASGVLSLTGSVTYPASMSITGQVTLNAYTLTVENDLTVAGGGAHLTFNNGSSYALVKGNATFNGADHNGHLGTGTLEVRGNFTQQAVYSAQSFYGTGTHTTLLSGATAQLITFATPGPGAGNTSFFGILSVANAAGGVSLASNAYVSGSMNTTGSLNVPYPRILGIAGALTLQPGSNTMVTGSLTRGSCINNGGTFSGFVCP